MKQSVDHRAIQHPLETECEGESDRLRGMNILHPTPLDFDDRSSLEDTREACKRYGVQPARLNAKLLGVLLRETEINPDLQASLVRGWEEGLDLGSNLPEKDHLVDCPKMTEEQLEVLKKTVQKEVDVKRLCGPFETPVRDGRWFKNAWVSPYFVIPKKTAVGEAARWRLIHHLSYHESGQRRLSLNGRIDLERFPTAFPTHMTGAHLIF